MVRVGSDIIEIQRIRETVRRRPGFWDRVLTPWEKAYCFGKKDPVPSLAGRFAAKEAILKCIGIGLRGISWHDLEIKSGDQGAPRVCFSPRAKSILASQGLERIEISISHSRDYALAVAVGEVRDCEACFRKRYENDGHLGS